MKGSLASPDHKAEWDLRWQPSERLHRHLPTAVYSRTFADTIVHSPNLNVAAHGVVKVDAKGLKPGRWYYYRFVLGGVASPVEFGGLGETCRPVRRPGRAGAPTRETRSRSTGRPS